jgi:hypothetical protein
LTGYNADWSEAAALALILTALCSIVMAAGGIVSIRKETAHGGSEMPFQE